MEIIMTTIWVLTEAYETHLLFAEMGEKEIEKVAKLAFSVLEDPDDPEAPASVEECKEMVRQDIETMLTKPEEEWDVLTGCYNVFQLRPVMLNTLIEEGVMFTDPDYNFVAKPGAKVYEAARRVGMGCDLAYAMEPHGYFSRKIDTDEFKEFEWIERELEQGNEEEADDRYESFLTFLKEKYDDVRPDSNGFIFISHAGKEGFAVGNAVFEPVYDSVGFDERDFVQVVLDGKKGWLDVDGNFTQHPDEASFHFEMLI